MGAANGKNTIRKEGAQMHNSLSGHRNPATHGTQCLITVYLPLNEIRHVLGEHGGGSGGNVIAVSLHDKSAARSESPPLTFSLNAGRVDIHG